MAREAPDPKQEPESHNRRIHPRLRMIANGGQVVNSCRSNISTTVSSTERPAEILPEEVLASYQKTIPQLAAAQEQAQLLVASETPPSTGRLTKRPKLEDVEQADSSYVNVFVEAASNEREADAIMERLQEAVAGGPGNVVRRGRHVSATIPITAIRSLRADKDVAFVSNSEPLKLDVPAGTHTGRAPAKRRVTGLRDHHDDGSSVVIGIIDVGGFDFAHPDFLDENGDTRFEAIWDQGGSFRPPPERFGYGAEFTRHHLLNAMGDDAPFPPNELEPQSQRNDGSHGTHVASIAAGNHGVCPNARIAGVLIDVPTADTQREQRRHSFADTSRIAHAVEYLVDVADGRPISINISLGTNGGAHDGTTGVSRWLDDLLIGQGRAVCVAAGNAGQEGPTGADDIGWVNGRIHTSGRIPSRGLDVELEWVVVGNGLVDLSENELEIWYSPQDRFTASVKPPNSNRWYEVHPRQYRENKRLTDGTTLSIYNELYHPNNGANHIAIYQSPNLDPDNIRGVQAGVWKVRLHGDEVRDGRFHAWIERDDPVEIGRVAGQRYLRFPSFFTAETNVDSHSISSLAAGRSVISVGSLDEGAGKVNVTSSQGPTRDGRSKPDVIVPGTNIVAARGFRLEDDQEWTSMTGTSMASPYVTGVIGLMLAVNPALTSAQCAGILQRTSRPLPGISFEWQNDAGFGQVDPVEAIREAKTFTDLTERR